MENRCFTRSFYGSEIHAYIEELAKLRITVFYDYPYLYEGDLEYERNYLKVYTESEKSVLVLAFDGAKIIGAATALPLLEEASYVKDPFIKSGLSLDEIYYFGESVLLKEYRGRGLGHAFFDGRENAAKKFGYKKAYFCGVNRPDHHELKPEGYKPLDEFWKKRGYEKVHHLQSQFSWKDRNEKSESLKVMTYWMKSLC